MRLDEYRLNIDQIDKKINDLLDERFDIAKEISKIKKKENINLTDNKREEEIFKRLENERYSKDKIEIYKKIIEQSKKIQDTDNIVLVGMPGVGKTSIAKEISKISDYKFIDLDYEIVKRYGDIEKIFQQKGEDYFRDVEQKTLAEIVKDNHYVLASGGGSIIREENHKSLRNNSKVYFLERNLEDLPIANRPLSKTNPLEELYKKRLPLYKKVSDKKIFNYTIEKSARDILEDFNKN
ncbi:MAG: shikimate kinase [Tissierellia bacterium]|nr:shikimate kinase [Tissierellia bacterium]